MMGTMRDSPGQIGPFSLRSKRPSKRSPSMLNGQPHQTAGVGPARPPASEGSSRNSTTASGGQSATTFLSAVRRFRHMKLLLLLKCWRALRSHLRQAQQFSDRRQALSPRTPAIPAKLLKKALVDSSSTQLSSHRSNAIVQLPFISTPKYSRDQYSGPDAPASASLASRLPSSIHGMAWSIPRPPSSSRTWASKLTP